MANDVSRSDAGFDVETNAAVLISAGEEVETPLLLKSGLASVILDKVEQVLASRMPGANQLSPGPVVTDIRRQLVDHLELYRELGVAGVSRDSKWRRRATDAAGPVTAVPMTQATQPEPLIQIAPLFQ